MTVTISDKARAAQALANELEQVSQEQLILAYQMGGLLVQQSALSEKSAALHKMLKELLK